MLLSGRVWVELNANVGYQVVEVMMPKNHAYLGGLGFNKWIIIMGVGQDLDDKQGIPKRNTISMFDSHIYKCKLMVQVCMDTMTPQILFSLSPHCS